MSTGCFVVLIIALHVMVSSAKRCFYTGIECSNYCCSPGGLNFDKEYCCNDCAKSDQKGSIKCKTGMSVAAVTGIGIAIFLVVFVLPPLVVCCVCCGVCAKIIGGGPARNRGRVHRSGLQTGPSSIVATPQPHHVGAFNVAYSSQPNEAPAYPVGSAQPQHPPAVVYGYGVAQAQTPAYGYGAPPPPYNEVVHQKDHP